MYCAKTLFNEFFAHMNTDAENHTDSDTDAEKSEYVKGRNFEMENEYTVIDGVLKIDLKGAKKENVSVNVVGNKITVKATKKNIYGQETKYEKTFILNKKYDLNTITAKYEDTILEISTSLLESEKPREIKIG